MTAHSSPQRGMREKSHGRARGVPGRYWQQPSRKEGEPPAVRSGYLDLHAHRGLHRRAVNGGRIELPDLRSGLQNLGADGIPSGNSPADHRPALINVDLELNLRAL